MRSSGGALVVVFAVAAGFLGACDQLPGTNRYEIQQDSAGRTIRLDKQTGEITILEGDKLVSASSEQKALNEQAAAKNKLTALAQPRFFPLKTFELLGVTAASCQTMWRDGKLFILVDLSPQPKLSGRSFGIGLSGLNLAFIDASGFDIVDQPVPVTNITRIADNKGKITSLQINWSLALSQDAYESITDWTLTWL